MAEPNYYALNRSQWQDVLRQWRNAGHIFGMIVGDLGYGYPTDPANVLSGPIAVPDAPPVFYTMGNHELDGIGKRAWIDALYPGAVQPTSWLVNPSLPPGNGQHVYFSFDVGPYTHFIVLDGDYMTFDTTSRMWQTFGAQQRAWLAADIAANPTKNLLVFVHEPIDQQVTGFTPGYTLNDKGTLIDLLRGHPKQSFIFSGHLHSHRGITSWKGIYSVHVQTATPTVYGMPPSYGVNVSVDGEQITVTNAGVVTNFDEHPMNRIESIAGQQVIRVAEDGTDSGRSRTESMTVVAAENGVFPTRGTLMLKAPSTTWFTARFISEQLIKIQPGMKFSFDIFLSGVAGTADAVTVQPDWHMTDGRLPPRVVDQNGLQLSQRPRGGMAFLYNEDISNLNGLATGRWYHREFDLSALAGHYVDGLYLASAAGRVNVGAVYVDNIQFSWPAPVPNVAPTVALTSPASGATFTAPAAISLTAAASDSDGAVTEVTYYSGATAIGQSTTPPFSVTWSNVPAGSYTISATAKDDDGATATSPAVSLSVAVAPPLPPPASQSLSAVADAFVRSGLWGFTNYGNTLQLQVKSDPTLKAARESYVMFDLSSVPTVSGARLRLSGALSGGAVAVPVGLFLVPTSTWSEFSITWKSRPLPQGSAIATINVAATVPTTYEVDVTSVVKAAMAAGQTRVSFLLRQIGGNDRLVNFASRESGAGPQILITP